MENLLANPAVAAVLIPFVAAAFAAGILRALGGTARGAAIAGAAVGIGLLAGHIALLGEPQMIPRGGVQKIFYIAAIATFAGLVVDLAFFGRSVRQLLAIAGAVVAALWIAQNGLRSADTLFLVTLILGILVGAGVLLRLEQANRGALDGIAVLAVASLGLGVVVLLGNSAAVASLAFALAAGCAGFAVWNWPVSRWPAGASVLFAGGISWVALAIYALLFVPNASPIALAATAGAFLADPIVRKLGWGGKGWVRPFAIAMAAAIPVLAGIGLAWVLTTLA